MTQYDSTTRREILKLIPQFDTGSDIFTMLLDSTQLICEFNLLIHSYINLNMCVYFVIYELLLCKSFHHKWIIKQTSNLWSSEGKIIAYLTHLKMVDC